MRVYVQRSLVERPWSGRPLPLLNSPDSQIDLVQGAVMITTGTSRGPSRPS